jgi:uncharacterized membrane protein
MAYVIVFSVLAIRQHMSFNSYAHDQGQFQQAIWNTAHGRFMVNTIKPPNTMGWHFSPGLALLALPYRLWSDARLLLVAQTLALAASGIPLFLYSRRRLGGWAAAALLLAYYLSPNLHEVNLVEFRRITLAVPGIALAWYGLVNRRMLLMSAALGYALLFKEDVGLVVVAFGLYLWMQRDTADHGGIRRNRIWGTGLAAAGITWMVVVMWAVIPSFRGESTGGSYGQMDYFAFLGERTTSEALNLLLHEPLFVFRSFVGEIMQRNRLVSILRLLGPAGFMPLLVPMQMVLFAPSLMLMLASGYERVYRLQLWYTAPMLPLVYGAAAVGMTRLVGHARQRVPYNMVLAALVGFVLLSPAPRGGYYDAGRFRVEPRHQLGRALLGVIPPDASVSAQAGLVPHLAHRPEIYEYPVALDRVDYVALDMLGNLYPLEELDYIIAKKKLLADPVWAIEAEGADFLVLRRRGSGADAVDEDKAVRRPEGGASFGVGDQALIELVGYSLAVQDAAGDMFLAVDEARIALRPGDHLRLTLYWQALAEMSTDYSIFAHLLSEDNMLLGQWDGQPGDVPLGDDLWLPMEFQRTSVWQRGDGVGDVRYIEVAPAAPTAGDILVGLYHPETGERLTMADGADSVNLGRFAIVAEAP